MTKNKKEWEIIDKIQSILHLYLLSSQGENAKLIYELCYLRLISDIPFRDSFNQESTITLRGFIDIYLKFLEHIGNDKEKMNSYIIEKFSDNEKAIELANKVLEDLREYDSSEKDLKQLFSLFCSFDNCALKNIMFMDLYDGSRMTFNTPDQICKLSNYILDVSKNDKVLDICSGYGNYLVDVVRCSDYEMIKGIEINKELSLISEIRLMSLSSNYIINNEDVFNVDLEEKYNKVFCNYPWGLRVEKYMLDHIHEKSKNMFFDWQKTNSSSIDWLFVNLALSVMKDDGKAVIMLPAGPLFKNIDEKYRKDLVNSGYIDSIIKIPVLTKYTSISQYLLVLGKNKSNKIKFIDISEQVEKTNPLNVNIKMSKVFEILNDDKHSLVKNVDIKEIENNGYILTVDNYVGNKEVKYHNPKKLSSYVLDVFRGYQITAREQKELESENGVYEVLLISDINDGIISNNLIRINSESSKYDRYLLKENDLIISSKGTRIKIAVVEDIKDRKIIASGNLIVLRLDTSKINPQYLEMYLNSSDGKAILNQIQTGAVIISINPGKLVDITISTLPIEKQNEIAEKYKMKKQQIQLAKEHISKLEKEQESFFEDNVEELFD